MNGIPVKSKIKADQVLKISVFKEVIKPTVPHKHASYFELIILSRGAGYHVIDDQTFDVLPPTVYFLKPGQTHCWNFSQIPKGYVILFREELLSKEDLAIIYQLNTCITVSDPVGFFQLTDTFCGDYNHDTTNLKLLKAYLHLVLLKISSYSSPVSEKPFQAVYYQFKNLINENYERVNKVQDYAGLLNISTAQLNLICKQISGKTPSAIINERILLESKTLLAVTGQSIKEIALYLQFADTSHFVKFFKANTNLTPGQYRELALISANKNTNYTLNDEQTTVAQE